MPKESNFFQLPTGAPFIHRDLSWLQFNERVLAEAMNPQTPLLERIRFLQITASNLDEFFMVRFGSLQKESADLQIRNSILSQVKRFVSRQVQTFSHLKKSLTQERIVFVHPQDLDMERRRIGKSLFEQHLLPLFEPLTPFHPRKIMELSNLQSAIVTQDHRWMALPKQIPSILIEEDHSILRRVDLVFQTQDLLRQYFISTFHVTSPPVILRITRNADFELDMEQLESGAIPDKVRSSVQKREMGKIVRVQASQKLPSFFSASVKKRLQIQDDQIFENSMVYLQGMSDGIASLMTSSKKKSIVYPELKSKLPRRMQKSTNVFDELDTGDILLHHPYDSFEAYVHWLKAACEDPHVTKIEQTVYRMDAMSEVIGLLKKAACKKEVRVFIELRARFDELNNLKLAEDLKSAGVKVSFGFGDLKLHAKITLVQRKVGNKSKYYTHLSTGNYHAINAKLYVDLALLTANQKIGSDVDHFFRSVKSKQVPRSFDALLVAPTLLHKKLIKLIDAEIRAARAKKPARIIVKVNSLVDRKIISKLYQASGAGVEVWLVVRGACSLIPGIKGVSDNIRVISLVDRFLEHSRIYYFLSSKEMYLSSADWMPRNFYSRLEIAFPVLDRGIFEYIEDTLLPAYLLDTIRAKELNNLGIWKNRNLKSIQFFLKRMPFPKQSQYPMRAQSYFQKL